MLVGVATLCWAIWRCRIDIIFNNTKYSSFIQVVFRGTYWLRMWAHLKIRRRCCSKRRVLLWRSSPWKQSIEGGSITSGLVQILFSLVFPQLANGRLCFVIIFQPYTLCTGRNLFPLYKKYNQPLTGASCGGVCHERAGNYTTGIRSKDEEVAFDLERSSRRP